MPTCVAQIIFPTAGRQYSAAFSGMAVLGTIAAAVIVAVLCSTVILCILGILIAALVAAALTAAGAALGGSVGRNWGPGSELAESLSAGDLVTVMGPLVRRERHNVVRFASEVHVHGSVIGVLESPWYHGDLDGSFDDACLMIVE
jgi:hypothetical protein